ncbi:conserved hypothetical protein [Ricinus communis]|uniref:Uncharacterized protein n=1 Tax=Ricinus communis TaxID=3988 RepID=B9TDX3_RICCO|nr:conserved hypothetical protein [Ricinus communis]
MDTAAIQAELDEAAARHGAQMYGKHPHRFHLQMVVDKMCEIGADMDEIIAAAWHDTMEDAGVTREEIARRNGPRVATLVWSVSGEGKNRKERSQSIVSKLSEYPGGITLKLTDRYCNLLQSVRDGRWDLVRMYLKEVPLFEPLFARGNLVVYEQYRELCARNGCSCRAD